MAVVVTRMTGNSTAVIGANYFSTTAQLVNADQD